MGFRFVRLRFGFRLWHSFLLLGEASEHAERFRADLRI